MTFLKYISFLSCMTISVPFFGQNTRAFEMHTIAFYNLENLFDTINDPFKNDEASPLMTLKTDKRLIYREKIKNMAHVIADIGKDQTHNTPTIIGVCEIENRNVLEDIANDEALLPKDYGIIHFESPDRRGIDVALLYQKAWFRPIHSKPYELKLYEDTPPRRIYTRDQLVVSGSLDGDIIHLVVNHWPSRRGGEAKSQSKRVGAAKLNKHIVDSIQAIDPYAKIFIMGDLNDNPTNKSIKNVLQTTSKKNDLALNAIYNPFEHMFTKKGYGTTAYRDAWSLFDQIMVTQALTDSDYSTFKYYKSGIYNKTYLTNKRGRWKGYPRRSFNDGSFTNGYSDHFPVYVYVIREVSDN